MKAWIGINVISDNQGLLNAVENALPNRLDSRLWDSDENTINRTFDTDGVEVVNASLFFNDFNERASFRAALGAINGFLHVALPGSYLKMAKSYHDELAPNGCPMSPDELEEEVLI